MNISKLLTTAVAAISVVSVIGLASAQTGTDGTASPAVSTPAEPDSRFIAPMMDASTMPQPSRTDVMDNAAATPDDALMERAARTDRN